MISESESSDQAEDGLLKPTTIASPEVDAWFPPANGKRIPTRAKRVRRDSWTQTRPVKAPTLHDILGIATSVMHQLLVKIWIYFEVNALIENGTQASTTAYSLCKLLNLQSRIKASAGSFGSATGNIIRHTRCVCNGEI